MKKVLVVALAAIMALSALMLASCGKSEFTMSENTEKSMTIDAKNAAKDDFFQAGSLVVAEGEQITIESGLEKGEIKVEMIREADEQSMDELPDTDAEPALTAKVGKGEKISGEVIPGDYILKATVLGKATGTVHIFTEQAK